MTEFYEAETQEEFAEAIQRRINDGTIWKLEGSAGRSAMDLIDGGVCMLGTESHRDYWGNHIPARDEVVEGTKGSYDYVAELSGPEWADRMAGLTPLRG